MLWALPVLVLLVLLLEQLGHRDLYGFDVLLFLLVGLSGLVMLYLKLFSRYPEVQYNWNILWATPTHFFMAFYLFRQRANAWVKYYFLVTTALTALLMLAWPILPQDLHLAFAPVMISLVIRGWVRYHVARRA
ncbi:MAG: hypothetical protein HC842_03475 [Cytophagales bacterium]|nr:hypothetical protein [Cytophagales bacterium]